MASSAKLLPFPFHFHFLFLIIILMHSAHLTRTAAQPPGSNGNMLGVDDCTKSANYTTDSTYLTNLNTLLSTLPSATTTNYGFSNTSAGQDPDTVNAIALCRGDVSREVCRSCVSTASLQLRQMCPNKKEAVGWHDFCMVRYSDKNIFHINDGGFILTYWSNENVTSQDEFNSALRNLTDQLRSEAAAGDSLRKFASGSVKGPDFLTIYGLMQCTPDISESDCGACLEEITKKIPDCCEGKTQGRVLVASCNLRFQVDRFYEEIPAISLPLPPASPPATESRSVPQLPPPTPPPKGKGKINHTRRNVIVGVVTFAIVIGGIFIFFIIRRKRKQQKPKQKFNATEYDLNEIKLATGSFSQKNILGQGTFGVVYEGTLKDGTRIAVKKLKNNSTRDENTFKDEVQVLEKVRHQNLVRLLGFSRHETRMLLIYEFVPKGTLDKFIYGNVETPTLNWEKLYEIIKGIAKGLIYLHVESGLQIVHRDLKPSNILLDENMNPKIADFGTARLLAIDSTHCSTLNVVGTPGYIAPEYYHHSQYSFKTDVYSYGIIVLQILSGKKIDLSSNAEDSYDNLQSLAWRNWKTNDLSNIINSALEIDSSSLSCIQRCIQIGLLCIQQSAEERPSMQSVYEWLTNNSLSLVEPNQPAAFASRDLPLPTVGVSHETDSIQASQFMTCTPSIHR